MNQHVCVCTWQTFEDDAAIVTQGDPGDQFFVIVEGKVCRGSAGSSTAIVHRSNGGHALGPTPQVAVHKRGPSDPPTSRGPLVAQLTTGDFFGERALIKSDVRAASCVSVGHLVCLVLDKDAFVDVCCVV